METLVNVQQHADNSLTPTPELQFLPLGNTCLIILMTIVLYVFSPSRRCFSGGGSGPAGPLVPGAVKEE